MTTNEEKRALFEIVSNHRKVGKTIWEEANCIISQMFIDAKDPVYWRSEYCEKNCQYKCLTEQTYKKADYS